MGCSSCGKRKERLKNIRRGERLRYKHLTNSQIETRFKKFKENHCVAISCDIVETCTLDNYRKCKSRKEVFEVMV